MSRTVSTWRGGPPSSGTLRPATATCSRSPFRRRNVSSPSSSACRSSSWCQASSSCRSSGGQNGNGCPAPTSSARSNPSSSHRRRLTERTRPSWTSSSPSGIAERSSRAAGSDAAELGASVARGERERERAPSAPCPARVRGRREAPRSRAGHGRRAPARRRSPALRSCGARLDVPLELVPRAVAAQEAPRPLEPGPCHDRPVDDHLERHQPEQARDARGAVRPGLEVEVQEGARRESAVRERDEQGEDGELPPVDEPADPAREERARPRRPRTPARGSPRRRSTARRADRPSRSAG